MARKPKHKFNTLKIGEKTRLLGKAHRYPYQYVNQYNKGDGKLKVIKDGDKYFVERVA